ncbi:right-handed parallel beta-helix repeat-containing protein [Candidatus Cloacimonadota bacterium]
MKSRFIFLLFTLLYLQVANATDIYSGPVNGNWDLAGSPYLIFGNIYIPVNQTLNLQPGVEVIYQSHHSFSIYGRLLAVGTETDSILFTAQNTDDGWLGLRFSETSSNGLDSSVLSYCQLEFGRALTGNEDSSRGGVLSCTNSSNIEIDNCRFSNNEADYGGAIALMNSNITMQHCLINDNYASHDAGGILIRDNSAPILYNVSVTNNTCIYDGGGIYICTNASPTISNSVFRYNSAEDYSDGSGGAISCWDSYLLLEDSSIQYNSAQQDGGGIEIAYNSESDLNNVIISHNFCRGSGGLDIMESSTVNLSNVSIFFNSSLYDTGGIEIGSDCIVTFDQQARSSIYLNNTLSIYNEGNDLRSYSNYITDVYVDTFTVINPNIFHAAPITDFTFNILHARIDSVDSDLYVSPTGSDLNSGLTAADPLKTITAAINKINPTETNPLCIYLANGMYSPYSNGETYPLEVKNHLSIIGSSQQYTILNAEELNLLVICEERTEFSIKNVSLINGFNSQCNEAGAIYVHESSVIIENVNIENNKTFNNGGGLYMSYSGSSEITNVTLKNNKSYSGGGAYFYHTNPLLENVTITENTSYDKGGGIRFVSSYPYFNSLYRCNIFLNKSLMGQGFDIYTNSPVNVFVDTFTVMQLDEYFLAPIEYINIDIDNARVEQVEQDLYVSTDGSDENSGLSSYDPLQTINMALIKALPNSNNIITVHLADGIYSPSETGEKLPFMARSYITLSGENMETTIIDAEEESIISTYLGIEENRIENMTLTNGGFDTQYFHSGGAIYCRYSTLDIENVIFCNNSAMWGGAIYNVSSNMVVDKCLFYENYAVGSFYDAAGGAIYYTPNYNIDPDYLIILNSTFRNNSAPIMGGAIYYRNIDGIILNSIFSDNTPNTFYLAGQYNQNEFSFVNCNIPEYQICVVNDNYGSLNWIDTTYGNPLFIEPGNNNFYLQQNSPCIDAGTDYYEWQNEMVLDLSPDEYYGDAPDIGAFEWEGTPIENEELVITNYELRNFPNPFNPETKISFSIPEESDAELLIYNIKGQKVKTYLINSSTDQPINSVTWNGTDDSNKPVSSGIYFYKLKSGNFDKTRKMLLIK